MAKDCWWEPEPAPKDGYFVCRCTSCGTWKQIKTSALSRRGQRHGDSANEVAIAEYVESRPYCRSCSSSRRVVKQYDDGDLFPEGDRWTAYTDDEIAELSDDDRPMGPNGRGS